MCGHCAGRRHADQKEGIMPVKSRIFCRSVVGQVDQFWGVIYIRRKTLYRVGVQELMGGIMQIKPVKKRIFCRSVEGLQDQKGALM